MRQTTLFRSQEWLSCAPLKCAPRRAEADLRAVLPGIPAKPARLLLVQAWTPAGKKNQPGRPARPMAPTLAPRCWRHGQRRMRTVLPCAGLSGPNSGYRRSVCGGGASGRCPPRTRVITDSPQPVRCCAVLGSALIRPPTPPSPSGRRTEQAYATKTGLVPFRFTPLHVYHTDRTYEAPQPNGDLELHLAKHRLPPGPLS